MRFPDCGAIRISSAWRPKNVAEHVVGVLAGLAHGIDPGEMDAQAAELERARRLARHTGHSAVAALPAGSGRSAGQTACRNAASEQGVTAFQEKRDRRLRWRLSLVNEARLRIGSTLDIARTAQEPADIALDHLADVVAVDLLDSVVHGHGTPAPGPLLLHPALLVAQLAERWGRRHARAGQDGLGRAGGGASRRSLGACCSASADAEECGEISQF